MCVKALYLAYYSGEISDAIGKYLNKGRPIHKMFLPRNSDVHFLLESYVRSGQGIERNVKFP